MSDRGIPAAPMLHERLRLAHLSLLERRRRALLGEVPLQDPAGHQHYTNAEAARGHRADARDLPGGSVRRDRARRVPEVDDVRSRSCRRPTPSKTAYNPFDLTKVWPHADYPLIDVGVMELNRNPDNYFAEIEQAAFSPSNIVPGIGFSPDKMLQARIFSYADAHRYRLGTHYEALPVNAPKCPVHHYHKDGPMRFFQQRHREPGRLLRAELASTGRRRTSRSHEPPLESPGDADRYNHRDGNDDYGQPRALCSACSTPGRSSVCSPTSPRRCWRTDACAVRHRRGERAPGAERDPRCLPDDRSGRRRRNSERRLGDGSVFHGSLEGVRLVVRIGVPRVVLEKAHRAVLVVMVHGALRGVRGKCCVVGSQGNR